MGFFCVLHYLALLGCVPLLSLLVQRCILCSMERDLAHGHRIERVVKFLLVTPFAMILVAPLAKTFAASLGSLVTAANLSQLRAFCTRSKWYRASVLTFALNVS